MRQTSELIKNMKINNKSPKQAFRVEVNKRCITTVVYLKNANVVVNKVYQNGNVKTLINPP